ncbi:MAG TPA: endonuclease/exonuclease/phosphatase family protein, partial [Gemmatimonadaceae bacterium]|nr:endonuclease/exonuclease/phosphatase family protein [Gemmatimonadaceae bacterium]
QGTRPTAFPPNAPTSEMTPCRQLRQLSEPSSASRLAWSGERTPAHDRWCYAVGSAIAVRGAERAGIARLADVAVVSWNMYGGSGDIDALIADLRGGRLDGSPTSDFVLLLQEAIRTATDLPARPIAGSRIGKRVTGRSGDRRAQSIDAIAQRHGLHLLYVPSLRNGAGGTPPEDRGNAILSTLPLHALEAMELPLEQQRRVSVAARVTALAASGDTIDVQLVSVHLDLRSGWRRLHRSFGAGRLEQARSITARLAAEPVVVVGGDLNSWFGGPREGAVRALGSALPNAERARETSTLSTPRFLPGLRLDHVFFRLPEGMSAKHGVVAQRYGSDHHPVIARIEAKERPRYEVSATGGPPHLRVTSPQE